MFNWALIVVIKEFKIKNSAIKSQLYEKGVL